MFPDLISKLLFPKILLRVSISLLLQHLFLTDSKQIYTQTIHLCGQYLSGVFHNLFHYIPNEDINMTLA